MALPFTLFGVRSHPQDVGLLPGGAEEVAEAGSTQAAAPKGIPAARAMKTSAFFVLAIFTALVNLGMNFYQYLPSYVSSLQQFPDVVAIAATVASMAMLGQAAGKILIGIINDKISVRGGLFFAMICGLAGLGVLLLFPGVSVRWCLPAALCSAFCYASGTVLTPLMTRTIFGTLEYLEHLLACCDGRLPVRCVRRDVLGLAGGLHRLPVHVHRDARHHRVAHCAGSAVACGGSQAGSRDGAVLGRNALT